MSVARTVAGSGCQNAGRVDAVTEKPETQLARTSEPSAPAQYGLGLLRGAIGAIPYVGSLLNEVVFDARSRLKQQRLEAFFRAVAEDVARIDESAIDKDYLVSDDFSDLIEDVCQRAARATSESKRLRFKDVLVRALTERPPPDLTPMFLAVLAEITEEEIVVLEKLCEATTWLRQKKAEGHKADVRAFDFSSGTVHGFAVPHFRLILQGLIRKGLAHDDTGGRLGPIEHNDIVLGTDLGIAFLDWLRRE